MKTVKPGVYIGGIPAKEWHERYEWCRNTLELESWDIDDAGVFKFKKEKDRMLYILRWL